MVSSPHLIPCIEQTTSGKDRSQAVHQGSLSSQMQLSKAYGSYVKEITCGGRHSAVITGQHLAVEFHYIALGFFSHKLNMLV